MHHLLTGGHIAVFVPIEAVAGNGGGVTGIAAVNSQVQRNSRIAPGGITEDMCHLLRSRHTHVLVPIIAVASNGGGVAGVGGIHRQVERDGSVAPLNAGEYEGRCGGGLTVGDAVAPDEGVAGHQLVLKGDTLADGEVECHGAVAALGVGEGEGAIDIAAVGLIINPGIGLAGGDVHHAVCRVAQGEVQAVDAVASAGDGAHDGVVVDAAGKVGAAAPHHAVAERLYAALDAVRTVAAPYGIEGHILVDVQHRTVGVFRGSAGAGGPSGEEEALVGEGAVIEHAVLRGAHRLRCHRAAAAVGEEGDGMGRLDIQLQRHGTVAAVSGGSCQLVAIVARCLCGGGENIEAIGRIRKVGAGGVLHHTVAHSIG